MIKYLDPYKDVKYGKIKGDKRDTYYKVAFGEGKFYQTNEGYILMANASEIKGAVRAYKPELPIESGMCAIPIYNKEYELWEKGVDGKTAPKKHQPSLFEQNLCNHIALEIDLDKHYAGSIAFVPDDQLTGITDEQLIETCDRNCQLEEVEDSGKLPIYDATANSGTKRSYALSPADKLKWLKKELCTAIKDASYNDEMSLFDLADQLVIESKNESTLAIYIDLVKGVL